MSRVSGRLIAIEGLDGVGKSTLSRALARALDAAWRTTPGEEIRGVRDAFDAGVSKDPAARCLAYAATVIAEGVAARQLMAAGRTVLVDRYWLSTRVYAPPEADGVLDAVATLVPPADLTLYCWAPEAVRRQRLTGRGALTAADAETLIGAAARTLDRRFRALAADPRAGRFVVLDCSGTPEENLACALAAVGGLGAEVAA